LFQDHELPFSSQVKFLRSLFPALSIPSYQTH